MGSKGSEIRDDSGGTAGATSGGAPLRFLLGGAALLIPFLLYYGTTSFGFVYDDTYQVELNRWLHSFSSLKEIFTSPSWAFSGTSESNIYRPLMHTLFLFEYQLLGSEPYPFHLVNILLHSLNTFLLYRIIVHLVGMRGAAREASSFRAFGPLIGALIFGLHPVNTEVVCWVSAAPELLYTLFLFASLYMYILSRGDGSGGGGAGRHPLYALSLFFFFVALFAKETAVAVLIFIILYDILLRGRDPFKGISSYIPYGLVFLIYFGIRSYSLGGFAPVKKIDLTTFEVIFNIFPLFGKYLFKLIYPTDLTPIYAFKPYSTPLNPYVLISLLLLLLTVFFILSRRFNPLQRFGAVIIVVPLLPALYFPALSVAAFADRYMYLPTAGLGIVAVSLSISLLEGGGAIKGRGAGVVLLTLFTLLLAAYSVATFKRSGVWESNLTLWLDTVEKVPDNPHIHFSLALEYHRKGDLQRAEGYYKSTLMAARNHGLASYNLGSIYEDRGDIDGAVKMYLNTVRYTRDHVDSRMRLAAIYTGRGDAEKSRDMYLEVIGIDGRTEAAYLGLGGAYSSLGEPGEAVETYKRLLTVNSGNEDGHYNLAWTYMSLGMNREALSHFGDVLTLSPGSVDALYNMGLIYIKTGRHEDGAEALKRVLQFSPGGYQNSSELLREALSKVKGEEGG